MLSICVLLGKKSDIGNKSMQSLSIRVFYIAAAFDTHKTRVVAKGPDITQEPWNRHLAING